MARPRLPARIYTEADAREFFKYLYQVDRVSWHPDDRFWDEDTISSRYLNYMDGTPLYTRAEAQKRDRLMAEARELDMDIYDVAMDVGRELGIYPVQKRGRKDWDPRSGALGAMRSRKSWDPRQKWNQIDLDMFTTSYIEAAIWSSSDEHGEPLDSSYSTEDMDASTIQKMEDDAFEFLKQNWELVQLNLIVAGHDFWLTRNHHGAGFWDGDWPGRAGEILTKNSDAFGSYELYVGDDNKVYGVSG